MAILHSSPLTPTTASATSAATGYPAINVLNPRIGKPWRSTATTQQQVEIDLGADRVVAALWIQSCNAATATIEKKPAGGSYSSVGTLTIQSEPTGRRKGWIAAAGTYRYLRITIANGAPVDGAAYWEIGAVHVFAASATLARAPEWGVQVATAFPQISAEIVNGRTITATAGSSYVIVSLDFQPEPGQDIAALLRAARDGIAGFSLDLSTRPWDAWPVTYTQAQYARKLANSRIDAASMELREVV